MKSFRIYSDITSITKIIRVFNKQIMLQQHEFNKIKIIKSENDNRQLLPTDEFVFVYDVTSPVILPAIEKKFIGQEITIINRHNEDSLSINTSNGNIFEDEEENKFSLILYPEMSSKFISLDNKWLNI